MDGYQISLVWVLIFSFIGVVIWFFLNRASVRANRQIELLESIEYHLASLNNIKQNDQKEKTLKPSIQKSDDKYLAEAREKTGL